MNRELPRWSAQVSIEKNDPQALRRALGRSGGISIDSISEAASYIQTFHKDPQELWHTIIDYINNRYTSSDATRKVLLDAIENANQKFVIQILKETRVPLKNLYDLFIMFLEAITAADEVDDVKNFALQLIARVPPTSYTYDDEEMFGVLKESAELLELNDILQKLLPYTDKDEDGLLIFNKPVPYGTNDYSANIINDDSHVIVPGQLYYMCTNPVQAHHYDADIYKENCRQTSEYAGGVMPASCLKCYQCSSRIDPQVYRA